MNFLDHDKEVLNKYNKIWDNVKTLFQKKFDSEPVHTLKIK